MATLTEADTIDQMSPIPFRVGSVREELADTFTLELEPPGGSFEFRPGQFTMLYVFGIGEVPISISGDPADSGKLVHTIRRVGAVTNALGRLEPGDFVGVRGPYGSPWPVERATDGDLLIIGGGIGLAPLRPVIYHALAHRDQYERLIVLYGTRTPDDVLFAAELNRWTARLDIDSLVTVDAADRGWRGSVGVVTRLISRVEFDPARATAFICGPGIMMRITAQKLTTNFDLDPDNIYLTMERNMKCGIGVCGHCQFGRHFVCTDGPVMPYVELADLLLIDGV